MAAPPRVIVTRPAGQAQAWVEALQALGVPACALPLIHIVPASGSAAVREAVNRLAQQSMVVFVSPNAVDAFFEALQGPWPAGPLAAATGPGTARALLDRGVPASQVEAPAADAAQFDSEALWARIGGRSWRGREVLIVRGNGGRDWLAATLADAGAQVRAISAYERRAPPWIESECALLDAALRQPDDHVWLFSSSEAIANLQARRAEGWERSRALATHPRIADAARALGFARVDAVRPEPADVAASLQSRPS